MKTNQKIIEKLENPKVSIENFNRSLNRLKDKRVSEQKILLEKKWDEKIKLIEEFEEYRDLFKKELIKEDKVDESVEIYREPSDINETAINSLADRIVRTIRSIYKSEDLDGGIGVDDVGRDAGLLVPLGGSAGTAFVDTKFEDPAIPKAVSSEDKAKIEMAAEVLIRLGQPDLANQINSFVQELQTV